VKDGKPNTPKEERRLREPEEIRPSHWLPRDADGFSWHSFVAFRKFDDSDQARFFNANPTEQAEILISEDATKRIGLHGLKQQKFPENLMYGARWKEEIRERRMKKLSEDQIKQVFEERLKLAVPGLDRMPPSFDKLFE